MTRHLLARRGRAVAVLALSAFALTGCQAMSPVATHDQYEAGDGLSTDAGPIAARNLMLVSTEKDSPAVLAGLLVNTTAEEAKVEVAVGEEQPTSLTVPAKGSLPLAGEGAETEIKVDKLAAKPGDLAPVTITTEQSGPVSYDVPVYSPIAPYDKLGIEPGPANTIPAEPEEDHGGGH